MLWATDHAAGRTGGTVCCLEPFPPQLYSCLIYFPIHTATMNSYSRYPRVNCLPYDTYIPLVEIFSIPPIHLAMMHRQSGSRLSLLKTRISINHTAYIQRPMHYKRSDDGIKSSHLALPSPLYQVARFIVCPPCLVLPCIQGIHALSLSKRY